MVEVFDHLPDGRPVHCIRLSNGPMSANVLTYGAIVQDLRHVGFSFPLVLGADHIAPYLGPMRYFGGMVGRFANRIGRGQFVLDGKTITISRNQDGKHCLHGGECGSAERIWQIRARGSDTVTLALTMDDGEMGFPGELNVELAISLTQSRLCFAIEATTDRDTVCGFAHHGYFMLDDSGSIAHHRLEIAAENVLVVDDDLIPTGAIVPVSEAGLDFRTMCNLENMAIDHNFCLSMGRERTRPVARLRSDLSNLAMQIETTEPGLQVYTATHLPSAGIRGLGGRLYGRHAGIALEAQNWPDAPNHFEFPSALLRTNEVYRQFTSYGFEAPLDA
jgi:aldose 1-epimerase